MNYQKQANYRQRKLRASEANYKKEKAFKKLKDRLRYLETSKMIQIKKKLVDMKAELKKVPPKKKTLDLRLNIKEITAKLKNLTAEKADIKAKITERNV